MAEARTNRRLAAILAADVVGYSRLMGEDEEGTLGALNAHLKQLIEPLISGHNGRIVKTTGDGLLAEFPSVIDAVNCAVAFQKGMVERSADVPQEKKIAFRIGINVGDVIIQDDDVFGDGVNVAARLEGLADPGGICVSRAARDQIRDKLDYGLEDLGEVEVKNIARPVRAFRVLPESESGPSTVSQPKGGSRRNRILAAAALVLIVVGAGLVWVKPWQASVEAASVHRMAYPLPDKPSVAVLPFTNLSDNKDREYFADGITEDIITDISKVSGIFVVARDSTFAYKRKTVKVRQIAEDLGVRYVLEGTVRRAGNKVRINAKLIDAIKGKHLWAERYDRDVNDIFAVQSEVTRQVVKAMAVTLSANELDRVYQKKAANIDAYSAFVRARRMVDPPGKKSIAIAQQLFQRTIELDPKFAGGYAGLSFSYSSKARLRFGPSPKEDAKLSLEYAKKAIQVDRNFAWSHIALGGAYLANGDPDAAVEAVREAIRLQPNGYEENLFMGFFLTFAGQSALAVKHLEIAKRISPIDSVRGLAFLANAYFMNGDYEKSEVLRKKRIENFPVRNPNPYLWLAATQSLLGESQAAAATAAKFRQLRPKFRLSKWRYFESYKVPENRKRLYDGAVKAGIPE